MIFDDGRQSPIFKHLNSVILCQLPSTAVVVVLAVMAEKEDSEETQMESVFGNRWPRVKVGENCSRRNLAYDLLNTIATRSMDLWQHFG